VAQTIASQLTKKTTSESAGITTVFTPANAHDRTAAAFRTMAIPIATVPAAPDIPGSIDI
jgi:hypothetical protein